MKTFLLLLITSLMSISLHAKKKTENTQDMGLILNKLRSGGNIIFFRHAQKLDNGKGSQEARLAFDIAESSIKSPIEIPAEYKSSGGMCLTDLGKATSWLMGETLRKLNVNIGKVFTSPICRCQQMANLLKFRQATVADYLIYDQLIPGGSIGSANKKKHDLFRDIPNDGTNTIIIGHGKTPKEAGVTDIIPEQSNMMIFSKEEGKLILSGHLTPAQIVQLLPRKNL